MFNNIQVRLNTVHIADICEAHLEYSINRHKQNVKITKSFCRYIKCVHPDSSDIYLIALLTSYHTFYHWLSIVTIIVSAAYFIIAIPFSNYI